MLSKVNCYICKLLKYMRYLVSLLLIVVFAINSNAQTYEIGGIIGGSNYIGDVGNTTYINPGKLAGGILLKWNRSPRHAFRFSYIHARLKSEDISAKDNRRVQRGYELISSLDEVSLGLEYNFWDLDLYSGQSVGTPYLYTGLTYLIYRGTLDKPLPDRRVSFGTEGTFAIPIILGYKTVLTTNFMVAAEIGARYTFTDNLDGSVPNKSDVTLNSFGNLNNNDWYMFTGITVTYTFGRKPCYCNF